MKSHIKYVLCRIRSVILFHQPIWIDFDTKVFCKWGVIKNFFWLFVCVKSFACDMFKFVGYWIEHYMRSTQVSQIHQENCSFIVKMRNGSANLFEFIVFMFHRKSLALVTHMLDSINKIRDICVYWIHIFQIPTEFLYSTWDIRAKSVIFQYEIF